MLSFLVRNSLKYSLKEIYYQKTREPLGFRVLFARVLLCLKAIIVKFVRLSSLDEYGQEIAYNSVVFSFPVFWLRLDKVKA